MKLSMLLILKRALTVLLSGCFVIGSLNAQYQQYPKSTSDALNQSLAVGTLSGSLSVSLKGAATYSIPLSIPVGSSGMEPNLSLSYNSQNKNGDLGIGWELKGISEIMRLPSNFYNDGTSRAVELTTGDAFGLDSMRLLLISGTHGSDGAVYGTEHETFTRVISKGTAGNGPQWFEARTKNGNTIEYGNTSDSRVEASGLSTVYRWRVNKITDVNGNYITFSYNEVSGESTISEIRYTGNTITGISPYIKIVFSYINKTDPSFINAGGVKIPQTRLLTSVKFSTTAGSNIREYTLKYTYDFYTHLNEVYETGSDNLWINSTIFDWGTATTAHASSNLATGSYMKYLPGDFNGDGIKDLLSVVRKASYTSSDQWKITYNETASSGPYTGPLSTTFKDFVVVDYDGDGRDEVLRRRRQTTNPVAEIFEAYYFSGSTLLRGNTNYDLTFSNADPGITLYPADFDGDGDIDYMSLKPDKNLDAFKGFQPQGSLPNFNTPNLVKIIDFNGDKRSDILVVKSTGSYIYSFNSVSALWETLYYSSSFPVSTDRIYTGDFNGDRKTDILYYRSGWKLQFSTGTGYAASVVVPALRAVDPGASLADNNYFTGDFNGDGKDDIVEMYKTGTTQKNIDVFYSRGDGSTLKEVNAYPNVPIDEQYYSVVDYNSDGQADIWRYDYVTSNSTYPIVSYFHKKERRDLIQAIRNGLGVLTTISYENLNFRSYNYMTGWTYLLTKGSNETFPFQDYSGPLVIVNQSYSSNDIGTMNKTTYNYEGAKRHRQGKGFLGFIKMVQPSPDNKVRTTTTNVLRYDYALLRPFSLLNTAETEISIVSMMSMQSLNSIDLTINSSESYDTLISYGNKRIFIAPRIISVYDRNNASFTKTDSRYDNDGNQVFNRTKYSYSNGSPVQATFIDDMQFGKYANPDFKNRMISKSTTSVYSGKPPYSRLSSFEWDVKGNIFKRIDDPTTDGAVTTRYYNNSSGLPDSVSVSAQGVQTATTGYRYDANKRFINKEINPIGQVIKKAWNQVTGNLDTLTDIGNLKTKFSYDGLGRKIKTKTPDNIETSIQYSFISNGYRITESRPGSPTSYVEYNRLGHEAGSMSEGQYVNTYSTKTYNAAGFLIRETPYGDGSYTDYYYDDYGRPDTITYNGNIRTSIVYDGASREVHYPDGKTKKTVNDAMGNMISVTENNEEAITYTYHPVGQPQIITARGSQFSFGYDSYGRRTTTTNPNSGTTTIKYDYLGRVVKETDSRGAVKRNQYDRAGRLTSTIDSTTSARTTAYSYITSGANTGKVKMVSASEGVSKVYSYDNYGRLTRLADSIQGEVSMVTRYGYDSWSHNTTITYPSGIIVTNVYDSKGYVSQINNGSSILWKMNSSDSRGRPVSYNLGDPNFGLGAQFTYDAQGRLATKTTVQMKQTYVFDPNSGNLSSRDYRTAGSPTGLSESFGYDSFNRLTSSTIGNNTSSVTYSANGNISTKSNVGGYTYDPTKVNAVSNISVSGGTIDATDQAITYNASNLTTQIKLGVTEYNIKYNPFNERIKTVNNIDVVTKYYSGSYEKKISSTTAKEYHYINSPFGLVAIIESIGTSIQNTWYVETDHLGSIIGLLRSDKSYAEKLSFDAWGRRRNPVDWSYQGINPTHLIDRGFTGHEHLDWAGLINMNGRMYDPVIGRFLGVDPFVQDAGFSQSYNGYSYCLNNPLKFTDPSGYTASVTGDGDPNPWAAYIRATMRGYSGGYGNFSDQYYDQYYDYLFNGVGGGFSGSGGPSSMTFSYYSKSTSYGGFFSIPGYKSIREVIVGNEKHTITVDLSNSAGQRGQNYTDRVGGFDYTGYVVDGTGYAAELTAKTTYRYGTRTATAAKLTRQNAALWGKVATRLNVAGAALGTIDCTAQGVSDYRNGNTGLATFEFSKATGYTAGVILIAISPFTAGSTAIIGGYIIAGTSAVDIGGDVGLYIYGRNQ